VAGGTLNADEGRRQAAASDRILAQIPLARRFVVWLRAVRPSGKTGGAGQDGATL